MYAYRTKGPLNLKLKSISTFSFALINQKVNIDFFHQSISIFKIEHLQTNTVFLKKLNTYLEKDRSLMTTIIFMLVLQKPLFNTNIKMTQ